MLRRILLVLLILAATTSFAQIDSVRIATYNLLHYGRPQANRYTLKNTFLQPILATIKPGIICFNEIDTTLPGGLDTLNTIMPSPMLHGGVHNTTNSDILDGLFWKSGKFKLIHETIIASYVRDIVAYDLYYDDPLLATIHDTVKLKVITAHLKSSNAVADRVTRDTETRRVVRYLDKLTDTTNFVMMGDFNLYKSSEAAYQNLTANSNVLSRLNDPVNMPGSWDGNAIFAALHTQSPRTTQLSDEGASGGLDSRFDFLLVSDAMLNGWKGLKYIPGSYTVFGNDGLHFNRALTDTPAHLSLTAAIIQALYNNADHLPVFADFTITPPLRKVPNSVSNRELNAENFQVINPIGTHIQYFLNHQAKSLSYGLINTVGSLIQQGFLPPGAGSISLPPSLSSGLYFLMVRDERGNAVYRKLVHE